VAVAGAVRVANVVGPRGGESGRSSARGGDYGAGREGVRMMSLVRASRPGARQLHGNERELQEMAFVNVVELAGSNHW
jgi:hypothetical protein